MPGGAPDLICPPASSAFFNYSTSQYQEVSFSCLWFVRDFFNLLRGSCWKRNPQGHPSEMFLYPARITALQHKVTCCLPPVMDVVFLAGMWAPVLGMKSMLLPPASSRQLPVRELSHMVVWTNPSTYRLHLWFGHTTKTTWELVPMFGHLIGISGRKPLQETWTWTSLSSITWCWCWACKSRYFPLLSQPSCSPSYST